MRRVGLVILAGIVTAMVALPSVARESAALAAYRARGNLDFVSVSPGPPDVRGTVALMPAAGRTSAALAAPSGGSLSLSGQARRAYPPNPCVGSSAPVGFTIAWNDGTSSSGTATLVVASRTVTLVALIRGGRFRGGVLVIAAAVTLNPGPPDCDASFTGAAALAFPPSI